MKLNISFLEKSNYDIKRGITFPEELTEDLAELIGIVVGDGHLSVIERSNFMVKKFTQSAVYISGNKNEKEYLDYVSILFKNLFNCDFSYREDKRSDAVLLTKYSKGIVNYLNQVCKIPIGKKSNIVKVPSIILNSSNNIKYAFLRGLADTDFYVAFKKTKNNYPVIRGSFKSIHIVKDLEILFTDLGFIHSCCYDINLNDKRWGKYKMHAIYLNGRNNLERWNRLIGFNNPKITQRISNSYKKNKKEPQARVEFTVNGK